MSGATARIVVQATPAEKKSITDKAKRLQIPVSELMRRGAEGYQSKEAEEDLLRLADAAAQAAQRASVSIDDSLAFIDESNKRIEAMEAAHAVSRAG